MNTTNIRGFDVHMAHRDNDGKGANDGYESHEIINRAAAQEGLPLCDAETLNVLLANLRSEGLMTNGTFDPEEHVYAAPVLKVLDSDFNVVHTRPWSRTWWDVAELVVVAKALDGLLMLEQDVEFLNYGSPTWADEGLAVEIWPRLRVRPTNI
jgi:hypothetical protein